jgi:hypothetical protein
MRTTVRYSTTMAALAVVTLAAAQEPLRAPTLQERVDTLERQVATIDTRFGLETTRPANLGIGETGVGLASRVDALERSLERLAADVARVQQLADNAARDAQQAQREAMSAQQTARDAAMRAR